MENTCKKDSFDGPQVRCAFNLSSRINIHLIFLRPWFFLSLNYNKDRLTAYIDFQLVAFCSQRQGQYIFSGLLTRLLFLMENMLGLLRVRVRRGINLAVRDTVSSDPYVIVTMGQQKLKTRVVKNNCNPEWNDELTLSIKDLNVPITLTVYDKDTLTVDDKMGDAEIDIKPYVECLKMGLENLPNGCAVKRVQPSRTNCLSDESSCIWNNGKIVQDMCLRLRNVECGEVVVQVEWIDLPGCTGISTKS